MLKAKSVSTLLVVFAILLQFLGYYTLIEKIEPVMYQFYLVAWWSYIVLIYAILGFKDGRKRVPGSRVFRLAAFSAGFWCLFELLNLRLQNWFYINVTPHPVVRFGGYFLGVRHSHPGRLPDERAFPAHPSRGKVRTACSRAPGPL